MGRSELRLTGSGGQGVILLSIIIADIALQSGKNVAQSQAYGPEARGGLCKAEVVISSEKIGYTKVINPAFLLALTQESLEKYTKNIDENCVVVADSTLKIPEGIKCKEVHQYAILETAKEKVGKLFTANIVACEVICELLKLATPEEIKATVARYIPKGTEEINFKALEAGHNLYLLGE